MSYNQFNITILHPVFYNSNLKDNPMIIKTDQANVTDVQQLGRSVAELTHSLEHSEKRNRQMRKIMSVILFVFATGITSLAITKGGVIKEVYAAENSGNDMMQQMAPLLKDIGILVSNMNQMMKQMAPVFNDAGTLVSRIKQDSDVARAKALMRDFPSKYPRGTRIDQFTPEALNSFEASNALVVGTIAEEVKYVNESLKQMNYSILVMARNMDDTMGRMGDFMP